MGQCRGLLGCPDLRRGFTAGGKKDRGKGRCGTVMKISASRAAIALALWVLLGLASRSGALASCAPDLSMPLVVTRINWTFDPQGGVFVLDGEIMNASKKDVPGPGITLTLLDGKGEIIASAAGYGRSARRRPGERTPVYAIVKPGSVPVEVRVRTTGGLART